MEHLSNNPNDNDGMPLELFAAMPWSEYLQTMTKNGSNGDRLMLQAAADIYNMEILVLSTLDPDATRLISPTSSIPFATVQLGYFAEEHYICIDNGISSSEEYQEDYRNENQPMSLVEYEVFGDEGESIPQEESIPSQFISRDNHVSLFIHGNNTSAMEKLPNEVLEKMFRIVIRSAGFS